MAKTSFFAFVLTGLALVIPCFALRFLHFAPGISRSHNLFNNRIACTLQQQGHEVILINYKLFDFVPDCISPCNATIYTVPNVLMDKQFETDLRKSQQEFAFSNEKLPGNILSLIDKSREATVNICRLITEDDELMERLHNYRFDAVLAQVFHYCNLGIANQLSLPIVWVSAGNYLLEQVAVTMALPFASSFVPSPLSAFSDRMTIRQRFLNALISSSLLLLRAIPSKDALSHELNLFKVSPNDMLVEFFEFGSRLPTLLLNGELMVDIPRPISVSVSYIGELHPITGAKQSQKLSREWEDLMNKSKKGVVLCSFGTVASTDYMPKAMRDHFVEAFRQFPDYTIVWKVSSKFPIPDDIKHLHLKEWVPQRDLLASPKTKLFITHGGYNSLLETCQAGVPIITIPLFADQYGNAVRAERLGISVTIDKPDLDNITIAKAMGSILNDPAYFNKAKKLAGILADRIRSNEDLVVFQIERTLRHFDRLPRLLVAQRMNMFQYYSLDTGILLLTILLGSLLLFIWGMVKVWFIIEKYI